MHRVDMSVSSLESFAVRRRVFGAIHYETSNRHCLSFARGFSGKLMLGEIGVKRRLNPNRDIQLSRADAFGLMGAAIGDRLGRWAATIQPKPKPFKPSAVVALRMRGICIACSHRAPWLHRPFVSPEDKRVFGRRCSMCGKIPR